MKYEYKTEIVDYRANNHIKLEKQLNDLAVEGWEYMNAVGKDWITLIYRRPVAP